jgi:ubiquinone/menaquinone biosynthesis C-methylase UbiE
MFSDPASNVEKFLLHSGMVIGDLGSGSGHYSLLCAKAVGDTGKVYSVDIQKDLLMRLKNEATKLHQNNIEVIWGDLEKIGGTKIRDNTLDGAVVSNILFQVKDKDTFTKEVRRILKPGGRVFIIDWADSFGGMGPVASEVFSIEKTKELFSNGFSVEKEFEAGAHHYGIIFKKS